VILEGLLTTHNADSTVNISPMGPRVDAQMRQLVLRPFQTSTTLANLKRSGEGVFHVTDNVEMLARAAIGPVSPWPAMRPAGAVQGSILKDACRWYALRITRVELSSQRAELVAEVVDQGRHRDFFGFNRAKHAVLEAAILATRVEILPADEIQAEFRRLLPLVEKTAGDQERVAMQLLVDHVSRCIGRNVGAGPDG
jgi:hypothetical protein